MKKISQVIPFIILLSVLISLTVIAGGLKGKDEKTSSTALKAWPEPFVRALNISFLSKEEGQYALIIKNDEGKEVHRDSFTSGAGIITRTFANVYHLPHGIYTIIVSGGKSEPQQVELEH